MQTTQFDNGALNNYASEPELYYAEYPSLDEQKQYKLQAGIAALFVGVLLLTSIAVTGLV